MLVPHTPRDSYLFRHFHAVLSDVSGYYDKLPVKSTNLFCAETIFGNVAKSLLVAYSIRQSQWSNVRTILSFLQPANKANNKWLPITILGILCDDPPLEKEIQSMIQNKLTDIYTILQTSGNGFLSEIMNSQGMLMEGLRGGNRKTIQVTCRDTDLLQLLGSE